MSNLRIKELEVKINKARNDYYNNQSTLSDKVYDALIDELSELDPKNLAVIGIGCEPVSNWEKYTHRSQMGSLNKCQTHDEFVKWADKYMDNKEFFLTLKLDGLSVSLIYESGILVKAATRGSGVTGELITPNVARMQGVPLRLNKKINATIRGEILLSKENHQKYFKEYSNTRNAASGISRRYDGEGSDKLNVLVYNIISDDIDVKSQFEQFSLLTSLGFDVPDYYLRGSVDKIDDIRNKYISHLRNQYKFELDGLVIHNNDLDVQEQYGNLHGKPYASIAYKFDSIAREAYVSEIKIYLGNSGRLTPVAIFNPKVNLMGTEVERANLHNFSNIEALGVDIGATVLVCRRNDVIPFIEEVVKSTGTIFAAPTTCPVCNASVLEVGEYIQCPNTENCPGQITGRVLNWVKELNILEWGSSLIEKLVESKKVVTIADLYILTVKDLASLDRMGDKSAQKCYDILKNNLEVPLEVLLGALSIPMIGQSTIKAIMSAGCDTLEKFGQLSAVEFEQVPGVGPTKAKSLANGLKANQKLIIDLLKNGVRVKTKTVGKLSGCKIAITGSTKIKRSDLEKFIVDNGGENKSSVGKSCTHLVIADIDSTSSKAVTARKLGIKLLDEKSLLNLVI